jgi:uncharacterized protein (TIGR00730 family)
MPIDQSKVDQELEQLSSTKGDPASRPVDPAILAQVDSMIQAFGGKPGSFDARLVKDLVVTCLKLVSDQRGTGELKLITSAVKELRHAYRVFGRFPEPHKVTIFGSARTPEDHPDYAAARDFGRLMAEAGWMVITGAGGGIMAAGHEGPGRDKSFGVAIRLPFEQSTNAVIAGDEKLIHFRYFFTRKLMFLSQAEAVVLFPGGFGTLDEAFEVLTLVQTGKATMMPIVMVEGQGGNYWASMDTMIRSTLLARGLISPDDTNLYHIAQTPEEARDHVVAFYRVFHSSRYVRDDLVIRLNGNLSPADVATLNHEFADIVASGKMELRGPLPGEEEHHALPRLVFHHARSKYGRLRQFLGRLNELPIS